MIKALKGFWIIAFVLSSYVVSAQRLNVGITFQYNILKQVKVDSDIIKGTRSYSIYHVYNNDWKFFSAGQSIIIGTVLQLDYKKLYIVVEPSFDLNTYNYSVNYPVGPQSYERLNFQTLFMQMDVPFYAGYQFGSGSFLRYSVFGGAVVVMPYSLGYSFKSKETDNPQYDYFDSGDMADILYTKKKYINSLLGFCLHFAHLGKVDFRYQHRLGSPSSQYPVTFNSAGFGITYYLPVNLRKKKIYYED